MKRTTKEVYVWISPTADGVEFLVRFHDASEKLFKINQQELEDWGSTLRSYIESRVRDYYHDIDEPIIDLKIYIS